MKIALIAIAVIIVVFVIVVALRPSDFTVTRSARISAPPAVLFGYTNDLNQFQLWSPWAKMDPAAKTSFKGSPTEIGGSFSWDGKKTGAGTMTHIETVPGELVKYRLDFTKPFKATNIVTFTFKPEGDQTLMTWSMSGKNNFAFKAAGLFMNMDKMCGSQFEEGLSLLKTFAEAANP